MYISFKYTWEVEVPLHLYHGFYKHQRNSSEVTTTAMTRVLSVIFASNIEHTIF